MPLGGARPDTDPQGGTGERYLLRERRSGEMARSITLPASVEVDKVRSSFEQGERSVTLPKAADGRARRIPVGT